MMVKLCLVASHGYSPSPVGQGLIFHQEQNKAIKDCQSFLPSDGLKQDIPRLNLISLKTNQKDQAMCVFNDANPVIGKPVLVDLQDFHPDSIPFSFGITKQCARHDKIMQFLMSGTIELERGGIDLSLLPELMELQRLTSNLQHQPHSSLVYPSHEFDASKPLVDFVGDMASRSKITIHQDGRVLLTGSGTEVQDILSIVAEFYLSKNSAKCIKSSMLVPPFSSLETTTEAHIVNSALKVKNGTEALKSLEKIKLKPSLKKKKSLRRDKERDLYKRSYLHACECLLSLMIDKKRGRKAAMASIKKSGPELPELLTQFSAGIAGTGLAVLLSVVCKVACGRVPFCTSKLFSTGFGVGLVWLSWAVNRLSFTIVNISRNEGKITMNDKEITRIVDKSLKDIYFGAATLMAVVVLRLA